MLVIGNTVLKLIKTSDANLKKRDLILSICFLIVYIQGFTGAIQGVISKNVMDSLEWYLTYTCIGISCIIWCYFKWDFSLKAMPKFEDDSRTMAVKKIFVYIIVMIISLYYGYGQIQKVISEKDVDVLLIIANATIIPGTIAFDRVFNQVSVLKKSK